MIDPVLQSLCALLEDEQERQDTVLTLCIAQGKAAMGHDVETLEARTAALNLCIEESLASEKERLGLLREIVHYYELPVEQQTMSHLIEVVHEPWSTRLSDFQSRIRETLSETARMVRQNNRTMRHSIKIVNDALSCVTRFSASQYDARGEEHQGASASPNVMDQRG
jgi:hypothetical protein